MTDWSAREHLESGLRAIAQIEANPHYNSYKPRVCFHLAPLDASDDEGWGEEATYCAKARPLFDLLEDRLDVDYVGGTCGIEAYELQMPSVTWLERRLPQIMEIAEKAGMVFEGWSFEPVEPKDATYFTSGPNLNVFNSKSPEGKAAIERMLRQAEDMSGQD